MEIFPYANQTGTKKEQVIRMFDHIAPKYDFLNRILSFGIDKIWRRRLINLVGKHPTPVILDVATGTGDLAIALTRCRPAAIYAVDISSGMLELARKKILKRRLQHTIILREADSESLPFEDNFFDVVTVAFGVRNFENYKSGLVEMKRVLKPGGTVLILEFSRPAAFPMKQLYNFYFKRMLPFFAGFFSPDKEAYIYLPASVMEFPEGEEFVNEMGVIGYESAKSWRQTFGIATIYSARKPLQ